MQGICFFQRSRAWRKTRPRCPRCPKPWPARTNEPCKRPAHRRYAFRINTPSKFAQALARQQALTDTEWLHRADELAEQQHIVLMELLSFGRDGASDAQTRALVDYLSVLQFVAADTSELASAPVDLQELRAGVERAMRFFHAATTDDSAHFARMIRAWHEGVAQRNEPVWAVCLETLQQHGIMASPLAEGIVVTLYAIADVFSRRLADRPGTTQDD
jgi:hypothetical protein